jgi:hypothetical protein
MNHLMRHFNRLKVLANKLRGVTKGKTNSLVLELVNKYASKPGPGSSEVQIKFNILSGYVESEGGDNSNTIGNYGVNILVTNGNHKYLNVDIPWKNWKETDYPPLPSGGFGGAVWTSVSRVKYVGNNGIELMLTTSGRKGDVFKIVVSQKKTSNYPAATSNTLTVKV